MRFLHCADTHLGFKQFTHVIPNGRNVRELDVIETFNRLVETLPPVDLVVIAGDVFHVVHPTNAVIADAYDIFAKLRDRAPVVIVAGNHETPKTRDMGAILQLIRRLGNITVVDDECRAIDVAGIRIVCVPEAHTHATVKYPEGDVLVLHGEIEGAIPHSHTLNPVPVKKIEGYRYVALGHYHVASRVGENAYYSGSTDYTSTNPWDELHVEKSCNVVDLNVGTVAQVPTNPARRFFDLPRIDATDFTVKMIEEAAVAALYRVDHVDGAVIRHVMINVPRHIACDVRPPRPKAVLNYRLDLRRPTATNELQIARAAIKRMSISELLRLKIEQSQSGREDITHDDVMKLGLKYLEAADVSDRSR